MGTNTVHILKKKNRTATSIYRRIVTLSRHNFLYFIGCIPCCEWAIYISQYIYILSQIIIVTPPFISAIRCGLVVRIPGFHPGGPGSIPGTGTIFFFIDDLFLVFFFFLIANQIAVYEVHN